MRKSIIKICITIFVLFSTFLSAQTITTPQEFFGFTPGDDRELFDYEELINYLQKLENESAKIKLEEIGKSPLGKPIYIAFISSAENISNLPALKEINRKLAIDFNLSESERIECFEKGKVFFLATLSMHSSELGPTQSAPLIAYDLLTTKDTKKNRWLEDVVYMMVPNHNPDGMNMVVEHFRKYKGTKYETSNHPGIYHKYVGHNINRDFITLSQSDNKAIARIYNLEWFPQVMIEKHQMGKTGVRYFVPPMHDPIAQNIDEGIWNWTGLFGSNMITDLTADSCAGVTQHYLFDDYWPGSTETCLWKNVIGMLSEAASVNLAAPVYVEPEELNAYGKGLAEYKKGVNMPMPWKGGWWRLADIVKYEISSTMSIIKTCSLYKDEILKFRNDICKKEYNKGKTEAPYYYILPLQQHDQSETLGIVNLMQEHGIKVYRLTEDINLNNTLFNKGDFVIPTAQPFRPFIKEVMESQEFPVRHYTPGGEIIKPYDIASWSLPLHRGVKSIEINTQTEDLMPKLDEVPTGFKLSYEKPPAFKYVLFNVNNNESYKIAFYAKSMGLDVYRTNENLKIEEIEIAEGSFIIEKDDFDKVSDIISVAPVFTEKDITNSFIEIEVPRIAIVESFFHDMDAGWTRFIFDSYYIPFDVLRPCNFESTDLENKYDVIIFPDENSSVLLEGKYKRGNEDYLPSYPPEYTKGMGQKGKQKLLRFIANGGIVVSWGGSTGLFTGTLKTKNGDKEESFQLPFRDVSSQLRKDKLYLPGSLTRITLRKHPLTYGMKKEAGIFYRGQPAFKTSLPSFDMDRRIIASFPEKNILLSGYAENEEKLGRCSALLWLKKGKGQLALFAFNPQFRSSTQGTFKLLFNAILL